MFVFEYNGVFNGKFRKGWGWMAVTHDDLPTGLFESSAITGGFGEKGLLSHVPFPPTIGGNLTPD